jgi:hypothetical protein
MSMRAKCLTIAALLVLVFGSPAAGQDAPSQGAPEIPQSLFVRLTVYPTASLSRYDYNNDIDLYDVRVYVELRRGSQEGGAIADARITAFGEKLDFQGDHYEKRVILQKDTLPAEAEVEIAVPERPVLKERFPLPAWLALTEPRPAVVETGKDLLITWRFSRFAAPVDVRAYDFRTGQEFFHRDNEGEEEAVVPAASLPASTIVRIYIIQSWLYKRFLRGEDYARGSEVNVIPWSQVFVRTK